MSSIAELKKELELVTEHLRIAKDNLEFLKEENEKLKKEEESVTLYDSHCMERDAAGVPCVKCGYKTPEESIDGFGKCDDCSDLADYDAELAQTVFGEEEEPIC